VGPLFLIASQWPFPDFVLTADFENQGAHQIAKVYDPQGKRTIGKFYFLVSLYHLQSCLSGVLTKPDRIPQGEEEEWLRFIKNSKEPLDNNWYCVKQPSSNDLKQNWTWQEARQKEREFFSMTLPWCELEATYQKYLRTSNLVERLSSVLSDLITKRYFHQYQSYFKFSRWDCFIQSSRNSR